MVKLYILGAVDNLSDKLLKVCMVGGTISTECIHTDEYIRRDGFIPNTV